MGDFVYFIWDEIYGYDMGTCFLTRYEANFALQIKYTEFWINNKKAQVRQIRIASLKDEKTDDQ